MVKHIVMFKFLENAEGRTKKENLEIAANMLKDLQGKIPTLVASEVRFNDENAAKSNYDMILLADYNDWEGLNEYIEYECAICKKHYTEETETEEPEEHEHEYYEAEVVEPTETEDGYIIFECECGDYYEEILPATGTGEDDEETEEGSEEP